MTVSELLCVIVGWAIATGIFKILTAIMLRGEVENGWLLAGGGALSVLFGVILAALVGSDLPTLAPFIGIFAIVVGLALIVFAFRIRERRNRQVSPRRTRAARSYTPKCSLALDLDVFVRCSADQ
jgi:uncharacterized membrane protein HdeD (DUF308 family)